MEISKPLWVAHASVGAGGKKSGQASSIFSLSLDVTGERLATAGLDCTIRIWFTLAFKPSNNKNNDSNPIPRLAAVLSRHTGAVLCVRWSPPSIPVSLLASGSDDAVVLIWKQVENKFGSAAFEAASAGAVLDGIAPTESYTVLHRLTGHESDVNGLEWSSDGRYFASCGLDGNIFIWDANNNYTQIRKLETEPRKPLKGLTWDPLGQYIAAQSNEGSVYIWRTTDWKLETTITSPFALAEESYTYFSRPSWSPDGQSLCIPDCMNGLESVSLLVERTRWNCEQSLIGHIGSTPCVKFSPRIFKKSDDTTFTLLTMGSQDGVISLWSSCNSKPLTVITGIFEHAVMDFAWTSDGSSFYVSSYDGTVIHATISSELIKGTPIPLEEQAIIVKKLEKQKPGSLNLPTSLNQIKVIEDAEMTVTPAIPQEPKILNGPLNNEITTLPSISQSQLESRLKNGKKRITPQLLQPVTTSTTHYHHQPERGESYTVLIGKGSRKSWIKPLVPKSTYSFTISNKELMMNDCIEVINQPKENNCRIVRFCKDTKQARWEESLNCNFIAGDVTVGGYFICALNNNRILIFSPSGRRFLPPLILSNNIVQLICADDICAGILENGQFYIWRVPEMIVISQDELSPQGLKGELVNLEFHIDKLNDDKILEFCFGDNSRLIYSSLRRCIFEAEGALLPDTIINAIWGEKVSMESIDVSLISKILAMDETEMRNKSISHMESQISACRLTCDGDRMIPWLFSYAQRLSIDENYGKVQELINDLPNYRLDPLRIKAELAKIFAKSPSLLIRQLSDNLYNQLNSHVN